MNAFLTVIEKTSNGYSAYCPDVPGVVAAGNSKEEVEKEMQSALMFHFEGVLKSKFKIPKQKSYSTYLELAV